jgi:MtaA/CmuA family methyltransferase
MNGKERVLAHLAGRPVDSLPFMPVTMMFACDRIGAKYGEYATNHRLMVEAQLRTAEEFDIDHVSAISDPAREAADCGATIRYYADQPPAIDEVNAVLADKTKLAPLRVPDPSAAPRMRDRVQALELFKQRIGDEKFIEGWIEGPCAEASDLRGINRLMTDFIDDPDFVVDLFEFCVEMGLRFARAQIEAGADVIGVGDAAASLVGPRIYERYVWPYEKRLMDGILEMGGRVRLHICGNTTKILAGIGRLGVAIVDLDSLARVDDGRAAMGPDQVLLGNIDPVRVLRDGTPETVYAAMAECHRQAGPRYIAGAGCEVTRDTSPANMDAMRRYAREHRPGEMV